MPEHAPQSFIIKIWLEETAGEAAAATWRGHITHVPSGERRYLEDLKVIAAFIAPYLEEMGVRPLPAPKRRRCQNRLRSYLRPDRANRVARGDSAR